MISLIATPIAVGICLLVYLLLIYFFTNMSFKSSRHDDLMIRKFEDYKKDI